MFRAIGLEGRGGEGGREGGRELVVVVLKEAGGQGGEIFISNFCCRKYLLFKWKIFLPSPSIIPIVS